MLHDRKVADCVSCPNMYIGLGGIHGDAWLLTRFSQNKAGGVHEVYMFVS
jgi:hypothetical protein